jgi:hypothetical protein
VTLAGIYSINPNRVHAKSLDVLKVRHPKIPKLVREKVNRVGNRQGSIVRAGMIGDSLDRKELSSHRMKEALSLLNDGINVHRWALNMQGFRGSRKD